MKVQMKKVVATVAMAGAITAGTAGMAYAARQLGLHVPTAGGDGARITRGSAGRSAVTPARSSPTPSV